MAAGITAGARPVHRLPHARAEREVPRGPRPHVRRRRRVRLQRSRTTWSASRSAVRSGAARSTARGCETGDIILEIDGTSTEGLAVDECVRLLKGPPGTDVTITIFRPGWTEPKPFTLTRARITDPHHGLRHPARARSASSRSSRSRRTRRPRSRRSSTASRSRRRGHRDRRALQRRRLPAERGRDRQRVPAARHAHREREGTRGTWRAAHARLPRARAPSRRQVPVVVLINQGTASAAEILAGALQSERSRASRGQDVLRQGLRAEPVPPDAAAPASRSRTSRASSRSRTATPTATASTTRASPSPTARSRTCATTRRRSSPTPTATAATTRARTSSTTT